MRKNINPLFLFFLGTVLAGAPLALQAANPDRVGTLQLPVSDKKSSLDAATAPDSAKPPPATQTFLPVPDPVFAVVPAPAYFPVLPFGADTDMAPQLVPVASNHALEGDHAGLLRAILIIHDQTRDANASLAMLTALAGPANNTALIIAPQFLLDADIQRFADHLPEQGKMFARWPVDGWQSGEDSLARPGQKGISSFTVLDLMLLYLADKKTFPDLQQIVIAGHGMGGDFVQRYAAFGQAPDLLAAQNLPVRFVTANATSYLYFTAPRPKMDKTGNATQGFGTPDAAACPDSNTYPYGLDKLNAYTRLVGGSAVTLRYVTRDVTYIAGEKLMQTDMVPDTHCGAMLEGPDRLTRLKNYQLYLNVIFGDAISKLQKFITVQNTAYDPVALFGSHCGMSVLFDNGECR